MYIREINLDFEKKTSDYKARFSSINQTPPVPTCIYSRPIIAYFLFLNNAVKDLSVEGREEV